MTPPGAPDDLTVVVCSYAGDDDELTDRVLRAVAAQAAPGHTLLVDMHPSDAMVLRAEAIPGVVALHVPASRGLGESRQHGIARSETRYVAFLDSDALPRPGWLAALRQAITPAEVAIAGGPVLPVWPGGRVPALFRSQTGLDFLSMFDLGPQPLDSPRVLPGNMVVDRELTGEHVFARHRGRVPGGLVGAEEIDLMLRMAAEGRRIVYAPGATVDHHTRAERLRWRWMWRRIEAAGREQALTGRRLEPLPRRLAPRDRAFLAAVAPAFLIGWLRGRR